MSFSGGTFSINSSGQPVVTGTVISSTAFNALTADLATGLSTCILKDGTQTLTGNIPMGGFKLTGLAAGSGNGDSLRYEQLVGAYLPLTGGTISSNLVVSGTLGVTGVATFTAKPVFSSVTGTRALAADSGKGIISLDAPITNSLSGDVTLNNTGTYFDGPSCAQGTSGTWFASGTVTVIDTSAAATFFFKLWDGTTVIASTAARSVGTSNLLSVSLSGIIASPAANIRISVEDSSTTSGAIKANGSSNSMDSTLTVIRIF